MNDKCENVSDARTVGNKQTVMKCCFDSLIRNLNDKSLNFETNLQVFYDDLSDEMLKIVKQALPDKSIHHVIRNPEWSPSTSTFYEQLRIAKNLAGPILILEDDYYFYPGSLKKLMDFYEEQHKTEEHFYVNPMEDFVSNLGDNDCAYRMCGIGQYWRKTNHSTCTFLTDSYLIHKYEKNYMDFVKYFHNGNGCFPDTNEYVVEANTTNLPYKEVSCYAPTPSLAEHMQNWKTLSRLSPFTNIVRGYPIEYLHQLIWLGK